MPDRESPKVLIIDDDLTVGLLAKESLQQAKFRVTVVQTAAQMRETLPRLKPAIILLDVQLPDGAASSSARSYAKIRPTRTPPSS